MKSKGGRESGSGSGTRQVGHVRVKSVCGPKLTDQIVFKGRVRKLGCPYLQIISPDLSVTVFVTLHGGCRGSINQLASRTPVPSRYIGQGLDSKPSDSGVKPQGKKSSGQSFRFPRSGKTEIPEC